jgi:hypothetical protein
MLIQKILVVEYDLFQIFHTKSVVCVDGLLSVVVFLLLVVGSQLAGISC